MTYSYDASGNITHDGAHTYQWDAENRLTQVDSGATASYAYDYLDRRVKSTVGSTVVHYVWDKGSVLAEHNASTGAGITDYVYGSNLLIGTGPGNALSSNGSFTYYLSDRQDIRVLTDRYGNYLGQQAHLPFGEDFAESGTQDKHHLTTYEREPEAGVDYAVNRHYEFNLGRFTASDPIADAASSSNRTSSCSIKRNGSINPKDPQSLNLYTYVEDDPINAKDMDGLQVQTNCHSIDLATGSGIAGLFGPDPNFLTGGDFAQNPGDPSYQDDTLATVTATSCITNGSSNTPCSGGHFCDVGPAADKYDGWAGILSCKYESIQLQCRIDFYLSDVVKAYEKNPPPKGLGMSCGGVSNTSAGCRDDGAHIDYQFTCNKTGITTSGTIDGTGFNCGG